MCFAQEEAAELQAPHAAAAALAAAAAAAAQHAGALPLLRALRLAPKWRSLQAWLWAASTLCSRTMYLPGDPAGALTPFGDLHNYRPPPPPFAPTQEGLLAAARDLAATAVGVTGPARGTGPSAGPVGRGAGAGAAALELPDGELAGDGSLAEAADEYRIYARMR